MGRLLKSISIRRPANLHTKICLKKKDNKLKICYLCTGVQGHMTTNQSAVSAFDLNSFIFLDLLFSIINASPSVCANEHVYN
jgi:hypothetical protein